MKRKNRLHTGVTVWWTIFELVDERQWLDGIMPRVASRETCEAHGGEGRTKVEQTATYDGTISYSECCGMFATATCDLLVFKVQSQATVSVWNVVRKDWHWHSLFAWQSHPPIFDWKRLPSSTHILRIQPNQNWHYMFLSWALKLKILTLGLQLASVRGCFSPLRSVCHGHTYIV